MRTHESNDIMAISETTRSAAEEPRVVCIVRDLTNPGAACQQKHVTLPASNTVRNLLEHISKDYGYQLESFNLLYERNAVAELLAEKDKRLDDLSCSNSKRMRFQITVLDDGMQPVKVKADHNASTTVPGSVQFDEIPVGESACNGSLQETLPGGNYSGSKFNMDYNSQQAATGFCGLVNQAMTCYLNSLLQTLFMTPEFRNALYSWQYDGDQSPATEEKCIPYQLQRLFLQMQTGNHKAVETTPVTRSFGWDSSHSWQQHDVQELCRVMFDALEINWKKTQQANLINELYQGKLKDYVKCLECKTESFRTDAYLDIPLVIKPFGASKAYPSVEAALKAFVEPEILEENNQYQCDKCDKKCNAHKGLKFVSFPYLLTLQLKRFDFDYTTMNRIKLNDSMTFPAWLDLNGLIDDNTMPPTPGPKTDPPVFEAAFDDMAAERYPMDFDDATAQEFIGERVQGEYIYELFSIMIHSGSAVGGHYYAYIKCFTDNKWYSFNDQSVTEITTEDIKKTYGGSGARGIYSTTYTSSTNAYMLMYRKYDPLSNASFRSTEELPEHIKALMDIMEREAELTRQHREKERCMCKIRTYVYHPRQRKRLNEVLEVDKDTPLQAAVDVAYKMFELEGVVPLDCVRLVRYNCDLEYIERSFDPVEVQTLGEAVGGVKSMYTFELLLEIRQPNQRWQQYQLGGTTYKVHVVDVLTADVHPHVGVRASIDDKVAGFKEKIASVLGFPQTASMRCVLEKKGLGELVPLVNNKSAMREYGHSQGTKIYVDAALSETGDSELPFADSQLRKLIDNYQNTIRLLLTVPSAVEIQRFLEKDRAKNRTALPDVEDKDVEAGFDNLSTRNSKQSGTGQSGAGQSGAEQSGAGQSGAKQSGAGQSGAGQSGTAPSAAGQSAAGQSVAPSGDTDGEVEPVTAQLSRQNPFIDGTEGDQPPPYESLDTTPCPSCAAKAKSLCSCTPFADHSPKINGSGSGDAPPSSPLADGSNTREGEVWDYTANDPSVTSSKGRDSTASKSLNSRRSRTSSELTEETADGEEDIYFKILCEEEDMNNPKSKVLTIQMDKRITMKRFKHILQKKLHVPANNFKMYKIYSNNQEIECTSTSDTLNLLSDDSKMAMKLGRVLGKGEYKVKIYELELNASKSESTPYLFDLIVLRGMTIAETKQCISEELKMEHQREVSPTRIRLRKKTWRNPNQVYLDKQRIEDDISMYSNWEMFIQIMEGPEPLTTADDMALFIQQWKPSVYEFGSMSEIVIPLSADASLLKDKLSEISGIPADCIEFAKGKGTFPGDVSVLDANTTGLDWNAAVTFLTSWPMYLDSGAIIIYRDKREELGQLTADKRKEIGVREAGSCHYRPSNNSYFRKEKALKIYTHQDDSTTSETAATAAGTFVDQPSELD